MFIHLFLHYSHAMVSCFCGTSARIGLCSFSFFRVSAQCWLVDEVERSSRKNTFWDLVPQNFTQKMLEIDWVWRS
jgi:hypothetical protein